MWRAEKFIASQKREAGLIIGVEALGESRIGSEADTFATMAPIFAVMSDPVVVTNKGGCVQFMNGAALRFFRVTAGAYLGVQLLDMLDMVECSDAARIRRRLASGSSASMRVSFPAVGGTRFALLSVDRTPVGLVMTIKDNTESEKLVSVDPLTGAHNRREFDRLLRLELQRADRGYATSGNRPGVSLLFIDVDHFHGVNERYGHQGGDEALRDVVSAVKECVREEDHICRYGGEEFCVIMPTANSGGVQRVAERIRATVESLDISYHGVRFGVTVSIGTAVLTGRRSGKGTIEAMRNVTTDTPPTGYAFVAEESGEMREVDSSRERRTPAPCSQPPVSKFVKSSDDLVRSANQAMLRAKRSGRNRVVAGKNVIV